MNITLHIERLIVEGLDLPQRQRGALQAALEAELGRLLAQGEIGTHLAQGGAVPRLAAPAIQLPTNTDPTVLGTSIAQAVYGSIGNNSDQ